MKRPSGIPRWKDEPGLSPNVARLLRHGVATRDPTERALGRSRRRVLWMALFPPALAGFFAAKPVAASAALAVVVLLAGGAGVATYRNAVHESQVSSPSAVGKPRAPAEVSSSVSSPQAVPSPTAADVAPEPTAAATALAIVVRPPGGTQGVTAEPVPSAPAAAPASSSDVAEELRLVQSAHNLVGTSPARALELTTQHREKFPSGALALERDIIEIEALLAKGERAKARSIAKTLAPRVAGTIYETRLERLFVRADAGQDTRPAADGEGEVPK